MNYTELMKLVEQQKIESMRELVIKSGVPYLKIVEEFQSNSAMEQYEEMFKNFSRNYSEKNKL